MKVYYKNKKLPECCRYTIDQETGNIQHEKECPERFLNEALTVVLCVGVCLLILAVVYFLGQ